MDDRTYKSMPLDQALLPDRDNPLLPTQNIPNSALGGLTIIKKAGYDAPISINPLGSIDITAPKNADFLIAMGVFSNVSPSLSFQITNNIGSSNGVGAFYDRSLGYIRLFNDTTGSSILSVTYWLFRIDGKVGSS